MYGSGDLQTPRHMPMNVSSSGPLIKNIFLGLIEYELNISVHIRFDLERYLLNIGLDWMCRF